MRRLLGVVVLLAAGCGETTVDLLQQAEGVGPAGRAVGGPCTTDQDCAAGSRCLTEKEYPGGTCSASCSGSGLCPAGSLCVVQGNGLCLLACATAADCRTGYDCAHRNRLVSPGEVLVCYDRQ